MSTVSALALLAYVLVPPALPATSGLRVDRALTALPIWRGTKGLREREQARRKLLASLEHRPSVPSIRAASLPVQSVAGSRRPPLERGELAAFYVNWDDNAFAALSAHASAIDLLVCEWAFVTAGGDSLRITVDRRVPFLLSRMPPHERPRVLAMISNIDSSTQRFDPKRLEALVSRPTARAQAIAQLRRLVSTWGLGGVSVDFEEIPAALHPAVLTFLRDLRAALDSIPRAPGAPRPMLTQAVGTDLAPSVLQQYAAVNDRLFLMLYDEHYGHGDPGPVASQAWYEQEAARLLQVVPVDKALLAIGAYGYDWNDAGPVSSGDAMTFQDIMRVAKTHRAPIHFDSVSLNPYLTWTDADSTDHVAWYLDGVTAWNELSAGRRLGVRGHALWRLGAEDPSLWEVLGERTSVAGLSRIPPGYDVQFDGSGELLRVQSKPTNGQRTTRLDTSRGVIVAQQVTSYPSPWVVQRFGAHPHKVALTFDDGPDPDWTPAILDTLASRGVHATFFMIGSQVERHLRLARRVMDHGHEVGSHTFTHPNLAMLPDRLVGLELDVNQRMLQVALDRRIVFFRAPYFGDAEPTTADELLPASIASDRGYVIAGLHVDSRDWERPGASNIVRNVLQSRPRGNVVLLHDGGGERSQTIAALGPLIDSLQAHGDTLVTLSGLSNGAIEGMVPLAHGDEAARTLEFAGIAAIGSVEWVLTWLFLIAVTLGVGRVLAVGSLALVHRWRERRVARVFASATARRGGVPFAPPVTIIVPAFRESQVIARTVESLLKQRYAGILEVIVVDDGSPDDTYDVAKTAFAHDPRVRVFTKTNGGKASALNVGLQYAQSDIVVGLDADTLFEPDTVAQLVQPLAEPTVAAVAGNAKVGNRINLLTRWQAIEYITSQNLDRRAFALLNGITVVPGAVGAWRRAAVREAGGFSDDTLAEDQDLTLALLRRGYHVAYAPLAIAWTEAPDTVHGLLKQRFRWSFGTLQCMWKHRDALLRPRYGSLGMIALPNTWIFQLLVGAIAPLADLMFVWSLVSVWLIELQHGATYAVAPLEQVLTLYAVFLLLDWAAAVIAILVEPDEDWRLTLLVFLQRFAYRQFMYWVVLKAFAAAARGGLVGWGKLERKATVQVPVR
ncbi:glycosyltransferase [Gemmatimonas sp.]|uniref:glycosyltransferase n=1 Tax=Gemmatimonas sp. TaxID=1962908 RepID=UPI0039831709